MKPPVIDTLDELAVVHAALKRTEDDIHSELAKAAMSAFSAILPYIRQPNAPVQQKHFDAIQRLHDMMEE